VRKRNWINEENINKNTEVVVLCHEGGYENAIAFDVFVRKDIKEKKPRLYKWLKDNEYEIDCEIAKMFKRRHKNFEYVFSNDFSHIFSFNVSVLNILLQIARRFRVVTILFEELNQPKEDEKARKIYFDYLLKKYIKEIEKAEKEGSLISAEEFKKMLSDEKC